MGENEEVKVSKYNSGMAIIMRLDSLWKDTHRHSREGNFEKWNCDLDRIWCELARDLNEGEYSGKKEEFEEFDNKLKEFGKFIDNITDAFKSPTKEQITNREKQYHVLMEKELFLRRLENALGKGTAWDAGNEDDWD